MYTNEYMEASLAKRPTKSIVLTARISPTLSKKLDSFAKITGNTKSRAVEKLLQQHVDYETWFIKEVRKGIAAADRGELIPHDEAMRQIYEHIARRKREKRKAA
jgi:predicted transcriptional regulator